MKQNFEQQDLQQIVEKKRTLNLKNAKSFTTKEKFVKRKKNPKKSEFGNKKV